MDDTHDELIALARTNLWLAEVLEGTGQAPPGYAPLYRAVLDGSIPATNIRGRWYIRRADLPIIGRRFGFAVP